MEAPAAPMAPLPGFVQLAFETFQDVEYITESGFRERLRSRDRPRAAAAQQQNDVIPLYLRLQLAHEARIPLQVGAGRPRHVNAVRNPANELPFLRGAHVNDHRGVRRGQLPGLLRSHISRIARLGGRRTIALPPDTVDVLAPLAVGRKSDDFVFVVGGGPIRRGQMQDRWRRWVRAAGITKAVRLHDLRHSHAAWMIAAGVSLTALQHRLGHASITVTSDVYGHLLPEAQVQMARAAALRVRAQTPQITQ